MMLTDTDIDKILEGNLNNECIKGYAIRINDRTFVTNSGKILWKRRNHATSALRMALEYRVKGKIFQKLRNQGVNSFDIYIYSCNEYKNAWKNFMKYLEDNGLIQIIEIEW